MTRRKVKLSEAVRHSHERIGRLSEHERLRLLRTFDEVVPRIPPRSLHSVKNELSDLRLARRASGRKSLAGTKRLPQITVRPRVQP